jgi:ABC-type dipeptide/oligopeptide/nickel transport system ATPase component
MNVIFGWEAHSLKAGEKKAVLWQSQKVINGHMLLVGKSGTGKTYTLKKILEQLGGQAKQMRVHVMDIHGDIDIEGASTVKFSESTKYGFNPLKINPDPDFGGVRKRIQGFLAALQRTSRKLGSKQEAALRNVLFDLYAANGFLDGKPETWVLDDGRQRMYPKKNPTLEDAYKFAQFKLKSMFLGTNSKAAIALEMLNKKVSQFQFKRKQAAKTAGMTEDQAKKTEEELKKLGAEAVELYQEYILSIQTGMELNDVMKYDSKEVMKSVVERLENLHAIGIFKQEPPPFDPHANIWRYDIKALSMDEKKLFVSFVLESIFQRAVQNGVQDDIVEVIVLDEAHNFLTDDPEDITNIIAKEARKFGVALICASQSPTSFSDDFVSNVGTKIILGIDQMFWDGSIRKLRLEQRALEWIVPHQRILVQINNKGEMKNNFSWTVLER